MATLNFYLDKPTIEKTYILFCIRGKGQTIRVSTGEKIAPKHWNAQKQRVKTTNALPEANELNYFLDRLQEKTQRFLIDMKGRGEAWSNAVIKEKVLCFINGVEKHVRPNQSFMEVYEVFLQYVGVNRSRATLTRYKVLRSHLLAYQKKHHTKLTFERMDAQFYDQLLAYYYSDLKLLNATVGKRVSDLKVFLNWATERGYNGHMAYQKFKVIREESDIIYLTAEELGKLYALDLSNNPRLEKVRDVFCLGCCTGLRFSDLATLQPSHVRENTLVLRSEKTKDLLTIPLREEAQVILARYKDTPDFLPTVSNQKTNDYLKELGEYAGIDEKIIITKYRAAEKVEYVGPKYEFLSTHTARRTFVTLSLESGIRPEVVMAVTGHKSYNIFKKYIKLTSKVVDAEMRRAWES